MKCVLVHDWLVSIAGAEKVLEAIYSLFPAPIYTLVFDKKVFVDSLLDTADVVSSWLQRFPKAKTKYRNYLPFFPFAIEDFDLSRYDVILSSSHAVAKGVLTQAKQLHICYCHTPMRYIWDLYHLYLEESGLKKGLKGQLIKAISHYLRLWDRSSADQVDYFLCNSRYVARRIKKIYHREANVIYPPVDVDKFTLCEKKENFYLTASRMVPYKRMDLIVEAFNTMPEKRLVVIGDGPEFPKIVQKAKKNIEILGHQPFNALKSYMQKAKAFVFAAEEDFGIIPVEAQACGTPVITYSHGACRETNLEKVTGLFFHEQSIKAICDSVKQFENCQHTFVPSVIRQNAEQFSRDRFCREYSNFVKKAYEEFHSV